MMKYNENTTGLVFLVDKNTKQIEEGYILEIKNSTVNDMSELIAGFYTNRMNSFTGTLAAYDFNSKFKWEFGYKEGKVWYKKLLQKSFNRANSISSTIKSNSLTKSNACTEFYLITYWDDGSVDRTYISTICDNPFPCEVTKYINPTSETAVKVFCAGSTSVGGGSGSSIADIKERISDPCLKSVVDAFLSGAFDNTITNILKTFGYNNKINLTFIQNDTMTRSTERSQLLESKIVYEPNDPSNQIIYLNSVAMGGSTKEYRAGRIIHEIIHANLNLIAGGLLNQQTIQHSEILTKYMETMASSLKSFFPNLTMQECYSLSLEGLGENISHSKTFLDFIETKGFNNNTSSWDYFANLSEQHKVGNNGVGTHCNVYISPIGTEIP